MSGELQTVTLRNVELLEADRVLHGIGSPASGDRYSVADLRAMADAAAELGDEWRAPATIDHARSGPALGWVEGLRVEGRKLVADIRQVPARFAEVVRAGGFRGRSCELKRIRSQRSGKDHLTVGAVSWLGARSPAARTLADPEISLTTDALENVVALYAGTDVEVVRVYETAGPSDKRLGGPAAASRATREYVDSLVLGGRVPLSRRDAFVRAFELNPEFARELLDEEHPDPFPDRKWTEEDEIGARFALDPGTVI